MPKFYQCSLTNPSQSPIPLVLTVHLDEPMSAKSMSVIRLSVPAVQEFTLPESSMRVDYQGYSSSADLSDVTSPASRKPTLLSRINNFAFKTVVAYEFTENLFLFLERFQWGRRRGGVANVAGVRALAPGIVWNFYRTLFVASGLILVSASVVGLLLAYTISDLNNQVPLPTTVIPSIEVNTQGQYYINFPPEYLTTSPTSIKVYFNEPLSQSLAGLPYEETVTDFGNGLEAGFQAQVQNLGNNTAQTTEGPQYTMTNLSASPTFQLGDRIQIHVSGFPTTMERSEKNISQSIIFDDTPVSVGNSYVYENPNPYYQVGMDGSGIQTFTLTGYAINKDGKQEQLYVPPGRKASFKLMLLDETDEHRSQSWDYGPYLSC
jgi:hypothetical protein